MDPHLSPDHFFVLEDPSLASLFPSGRPVWCALDVLGMWLRDRLKLTHPRIPVGFVRRNLILQGSQILDGDFRMEFGGGEERPVRVFQGEEELPGASVVMEGAHVFDEEVAIGPGTIVEPGALLKGPTVIGGRCEVRQGAYLRGGCLVLDDCIVGHDTEVKNSIFLAGAKAGHFAYVGDSILGRNVNLGAGTKLANLMIVEGKVAIRVGNSRFPTDRRKLGAILGDGTEMGCNSVTSPGTLLGPRSVVYPCVSVPAGYYPPSSRVSASRESLRIRHLRETPQVP